jgi:hypothetical protein
MKNKNSKAPETKEYIDLSNLTVRPIHIDEENTWNTLMSKYHYLGFNSLVGESIKYVAELNGK